MNRRLISGLGALLIALPGYAGANADSMVEREIQKESRGNPKAYNRNSGARVEFVKEHPKPNVEFRPILTLKRTDYTDKHVMGELYIGLDKLGYTLEPPWKNNHPDISCIPEGDYKLAFRTTGKFANRSYEIMNVPGRENILIHVGNFPKDTHGCPLLGREKARGCVNESRYAMEGMLRTLEKDKEYTIRVIDGRKNAQAPQDKYAEVIR